MRILLTALLVTILAGNLPAASADSGEEELILVFGASGRSGRFIIEQLAASGRPFLAATSNVERARDKVPGDYNWVQADVREPTDLDELFKGVTLVISSLGATQFQGPNGPEFVDYQGVRNVVDAALRNGAKQMVLISASGVTDPDHPLNKMGQVMTWKLKGENYLRNSGLAYTIIRPGGLKDTAAGETGVVFMQGDKVPYNSPISVTSRGDLAAVCIASLSTPEARSRTFEVFNDPQQPVNGWRSAFAGLVADY